MRRGGSTIEVRPLPWALRGLLIVIGVLPWVLPIARAALPLGRFGDALDAAFWPVCHRIPERSIALAGVLMPICSRCAGIFAGAALGAAIARPRASFSAYKWMLFAAAAVMVIDVATQDLGLHPVLHPARIATGVFLGYVMAAAFVLHAWQRSDG